MKRNTQVDSQFFNRWSSEMAYVLGVICADGCLVEHANGYHCLNITSKDLSWLQQIRQTLQAQQKISSKQEAYQLQIRNQIIYNSLLALGLTPRKSKTLRLPFVPPAVFPDFVRGYFDGDGTVWFWRDIRWRHPWQLKASFYSGSQAFLVELRLSLQRYAQLSPGSLTTLPTAFELRYGIRDGLQLYHWMYWDHSVPCLQRKRNKFEEFLTLKAGSSHRELN